MPKPKKVELTDEEEAAPDALPSPAEELASSASAAALTQENLAALGGLRLEAGAASEARFSLSEFAYFVHLTTPHVAVECSWPGLRHALGHGIAWLTGILVQWDASASCFAFQWVKNHQGHMMLHGNAETEPAIQLLHFLGHLPMMETSWVVEPPVSEQLYAGFQGCFLQATESTPMTVQPLLSVHGHSW